MSSNKTVIVTGASSGLGFAMAKAFLDLGYNVVGNARTQERLDAAAAELGNPDRFLGVAGDISLQELAGIAGLSTSHFGRAFKQSKGVTPHRYLTQRRVQRAQELLAGTELAFSEIALAAGFADQSHFCRQFRSVVGTTPSTYRCSKR